MIEDFRNYEFGVVTYVKMSIPNFMKFHPGILKLLNVIKSEQCTFAQ
jgi:hypothetical protein